MQKSCDSNDCPNTFLKVAPGDTKSQKANILPIIAEQTGTYLEQLVYARDPSPLSNIDVLLNVLSPIQVDWSVLGEY